jgi:hypothetical protein
VTHDRDRAADRAAPAVAAPRLPQRPHVHSAPGVAGNLAGGSTPAQVSFAHDFSRVPARGIDSDRLSDWLPAARGPLGDTPLHYPSLRADRVGARALFDTSGIHLSTAAGSLPPSQLDTLLAHEGVHAAQQRDGRSQGDTTDRELEAHALAPDLAAGRSVIPRYRAGSAPLMDTPVENAAVAAAKKRRALLLTYADEWAAREARRLQTGADRDPLLEKRTKMDEDLPEPRGQRAKMEEDRIAKLNRLPLKIDMDDDSVTFRVKFHVRFENPSIASRFDELKGSALDGIKMVWEQRLKGVLLGGRKFTIEPDFKLISTTAARDPNYWLITVRPNDGDVATYAGCTLDKTEPGVPTSVTDPLCDGGVMSIPPLHVGRPSILGHELLHLFGLLDRYIAVISKTPGKKTIVETAPSRETNGRRDPLGGEQGTILAEDLAFLFDRLGVYEMAQNRGLDTLRALEKQGLTIYAVRAEIYRQEEIIKRGGKQPLLYKPRTNFNDKMIRDAENL